MDKATSQDQALAGAAAGEAAPDGALSLEASFLHNPPEAGLHCHCACLLITKEKEMLAVWYGYPEEEYESAKLVISRRPKGQKEWSPGAIILGEMSYSAGNPVLFEAPDGTIWLLYVVLKGKYWDDAELQGVCSKDGARTWSKPTVLWKERGMMVRHHPVVVGGGRLLLPAYSENGKEPVILCSDAPYNVWREAYRFKGLPLIQPSLVKEASGRLNMFFRPTTMPQLIWRSHSEDDGATWSAPVRTSLPNPLTGIAAVALKDHIAMIYNHTEEHKRNPLSVAVSPDGGLSWSDPIHFDTLSFELSYPHFLCDEEDRIHGLYTYNRRMIKYVSFSAREIVG